MDPLTDAVFVGVAVSISVPYDLTQLVNGRLSLNAGFH